MAATIIETSEDGTLIEYHDDPKVPAYAYICLMQKQGRRTSTTFTDDYVEVRADGVATLRFVRR